MKVKNSSIFVIIILCVFGFGCNKNQYYSEIPYSSVYIVFYPESLDNELNPIGGYKYFPYTTAGEQRGYAGVVVVHTGMDEFVAFDMACPFDYADGCKITTDGFTFKDNTCCQNVFDINGLPVVGNNKNYMLKKYRVRQESSRWVVTN